MLPLNCSFPATTMSGRYAANKIVRAEEQHSSIEKATKRSSSDRQVKGKVRHDGRRRIKKDGLMCIYVIHLLARSLLEGAFLCGQYFLYGFAVPPTYKCSVRPCPKNVDCFVSRPAEKTIFLLLMYVISVLCLVLCVVEMLHLEISAICYTIRPRKVQLPDEELGDMETFLWNIPSAPPGPDIARKCLLVPTGNHSQPQRQQYTNNDENWMGDASRGVHKDIGQPPNKLEVNSQACIQLQSHSNNHSKCHQEASRRDSNKADMDSCNSSSSKYGATKCSGWI